MFFEAFFIAICYDHELNPVDYKYCFNERMWAGQAFTIKIQPTPAKCHRQLKW